MLRRGTVVLISVALLSGCASAPTGPSVMVLPGLGKSLEQFNADDVSCRQWGLQATGMTPAEAAAASGAKNAAVDTGGAAVGSAASVSGVRYSGQEGQWRYDMAYQQCMYSRGHQIPGVPAGYRNPIPQTAPLPGIAPTPSDTSSIPPPPPGPPPPPPPGLSR